MVTNNVTVYQFEVGLDEVFADEVILQMVFSEPSTVRCICPMILVKQMVFSEPSTVRCICPMILVK